MSPSLAINPRIVEGLYCEALVLSDEVRAAFSFAPGADPEGRDDDAARIALSCEGLRTTTRMMHAVAWLLNQRAFFAGELSQFQLMRYGKLAVLAGSDPARLAQLQPEVRELIGSTERFYARLARIDRGFRESDNGAPSAVERLRERLGRALER